MKPRACSLLGTTLLVLLWASHALAAGAPQYVSSDPAKGESLHEAPERVEVTFSEPLDPSSDMAVSDECGRRVDDGQVEVVATQMSVGIEKQPAGKYTVEYTAVGIGGVTGSAGGSYSFSVHRGPTCPGGPGHGGHGNGHNGTDGGEQGHGHDRGEHDPSVHGSGEAHEGDHTVHGATHASGSAAAHEKHDGRNGRHDHNGRGHEKHHPKKADEPPELAGPGLRSERLDGSTAAVTIAVAMLFGVAGGGMLRRVRSS
jgi:methionine-rich copper-binding protein CopC